MRDDDNIWTGKKSITSEFVSLIGAQSSQVRNTGLCKSVFKISLELFSCLVKNHLVSQKII